MVTLAKIHLKVTFKDILYIYIIFIINQILKIEQSLASTFTGDSSYDRAVQPSAQNNFYISFQFIKSIMCCIKDELKRMKV